MTKYREPSSVVEMAEMCRKVKYKTVSLPHSGFVSHEEAQAAFGILDTLEEADFYELDASIDDAANEMFDTFFVGKDLHDMPIEKDCRLPSKVCMLWSPQHLMFFKNREEAFPFAHYGIEVNNITYVYLISPYFAPMLQATYKAGGEGLRFLDLSSEHKIQLRAENTLYVAGVCSILNQPSFTKREPAGSRQERRAAQRSATYAADAWHKVTWNIGEEVKAKLTRDEPVRCMPLHYTRGHWRRAEDGWKNTTQRKDGLWYQWIEGFWSGHPAFGIKKSYHAPKIGKSTF
jgi:hypothetical protein